MGAIRYAGVVLTPLAGMVADRFSRRNLLIYSQALGILIAAFMVVLLLAGILEVWHIIVLTLLRGINFAVDFPVRYALVVDLVAPEEQLNAVSLNRASSDVTAALGPVAGGALMVLLGYAGAFWLMLAPERHESGLGALYGRSSSAGDEGGRDRSGAASRKVFAFADATMPLWECWGWPVLPICLASR